MVYVHLCLSLYNESLSAEEDTLAVCLLSQRTARVSGLETWIVITGIIITRVGPVIQRPAVQWSTSILLINSFVSNSPSPTHMNHLRNPPNATTPMDQNEVAYTDTLMFSPMDVL